MRYLSLFRRSVQIAVIILFCGLPWLNANGFYQIKGSLFASDFFGLPFADPASTLQIVGQGAAEGSLPSSGLYIGALITLVIAFLLGRVFCGWLCPYGFFSEFAIRLRRKNAAPKCEFFNITFWSRTALAGMAILIAILVSYPAMNLLSMPGQLSLLPLFLWQHMDLFLLVTFAIPGLVLLAELASGKRLWCQYCCPQSVFLAFASWVLPKKFPGLRIRWQANKCICGKISPCRQKCSLNLNPRQKDGPSRRDCMMCGDCVQVCMKYGKALAFAEKEKSSVAKVGSSEKNS